MEAVIVDRAPSSITTHFSRRSIMQYLDSPNHVFLPERLPISIQAPSWLWFAVGSLSFRDDLMSEVVVLDA